MKILLAHKSLMEHDLSIFLVYFHVKVCETLIGRQQIIFSTAQQRGEDFVEGTSNEGMTE